MAENLNNDQVYVLTLYIMGASPNSARAVSNIRTICNEHLHNRYELKIIDVYQQPGIAQDEQLVALPMLVKHSPLPIKKLVGNMSDIEKILDGLEIDHEITEIGK